MSYFGVRETEKWLDGITRWEINKLAKERKRGSGSDNAEKLITGKKILIVTGGSWKIDKYESGYYLYIRRRVKRGDSVYDTTKVTKCISAFVTL